MSISLNPKCWNRVLILIAFFSNFFFFNGYAQDTAFPGAQGWASTITGGRGGQIIRVTNLNASGAGSLKSAIDTPGPRIIVFEVGGVINISSLPYSKIQIKYGDVTIAGQTAPPPGISIVGGFIQSYGNNIVIQHLRIRPGAVGRPSGWEPDCFSPSSSNIILDHCSFSWSVDENVGIWPWVSPFEGSTPDQWRANSPHNITISNCIISEALMYATHTKNPHSMGLIVGDNSTDVAIVGNLLHSNNRRNPLFKAGSRGVVVNNYIYNPGDWAINYVEGTEWSGRNPEWGYMTVIGNVLQYGPNTPSTVDLVTATPAQPDALVKIYMKDNIAKNRTGGSVRLYSGDSKHLVSSIPTWHNSIQPTPASNLKNQMVQNVGARPWDRDPIDARIINEMLSDGSKGSIINYETEVGGLPKYTTTYASFNPADWDLRYMIRKTTSNSPPTLASIGNKTVTEGNVLDVQLSASDPNGDAIRFSVSPNLSFITLKDNQNGTALLKISPVSEDAGTYNITVSASDPNNTKDSEVITLTVNQAVVPNTPPVLTTIGAKTVTEGKILEVPISASDANGDAIRFTVSPDLSFITLTDNQNGTGILKIAPTSDDAGTYNITVTASDTNNDKDSETFTLTINQAVVPNSPPVLISIGNKTATEDKILNVPLSASDADGDAIYLSYSPILSFVTLTDNQDGTGVLKIAPTSGNAGTFTITVTASDPNNGQDSKTFTLTVNKAVVTNTAPVLTSIGNQTVVEGSTLNLELKATDTDGGALTYSVSPNFGFITLNDQQDGNAVLKLSPQSGDAGEYNLTIVVTDDNNAKDSETIHITVNEAQAVNTAPVLNSVGDKTVKVGQKLNITFSSSDSDGDALGYTLSRNLRFAIFTDKRDGTAILELSPDQGDVGRYTLTITVTDENGGSDSESISIYVEAENTAPVFSTIGNIDITENEKLNIPFSSNDVDGDVLRYTISPNISFISMSYDPGGSGILSLNPKPGDSGTYNITITVFDTHDASDSEVIKITVNERMNGNSNPQLKGVGNINVKNGNKFDKLLSSTDPDGDAITYSLSRNLRFATFTDYKDGTALLSLSPTKNDIGRYTLTITVKDANNGTDSESISIYVEDGDFENLANSPVTVTGVNSGGTTFTLGGTDLLQDQYYDDGFVYDVSDPIEGTNNDYLYQTERFGALKYNIPVPGYGNYTVRLHFAEIYYLSGAVGARVFNVNVEDGQGTLNNYDINADVGPLKATIRTFNEISVYDGKLTIELSSVIGNPKISAIEILKEGDFDIIAGIEPDDSERSLSIYPNPTNGICTIELPLDKYSVEELPYVLYDLAGRVVDQSTVNGSQITVDLNGNKKGIYIIKVGNFPPKKIFLQ